KLTSISPQPQRVRSKSGRGKEKVMRGRWFTLIALLGVIGLPVAARADGPPTLVVRVQPIETLLANVKQLATLAGKAEDAKQLDAFVRSRIGDNGIDGIDIKRPLGLYSTLTADVTNSPTVAVIPIASQKEFLALLTNFNLPATKAKDGSYSVTPEK